MLVLQRDEDAELDSPKTSLYQYSKIVMRLKLHNFTDPESGILAFTATVYRSDGWLIQPETSLGARDFVTFAVPSTTDGRTLRASLFTTVLSSLLSSTQA